ncbi:MAG: tyrosine-type recombinase/integrase [Clostridiales bacterium]|jgi:site-specific recombinase XerD|nr:tyrosine-type recombinase/integrase [Clostridiales bacterium]
MAIKTKNGDRFYLTEKDIDMFALQLTREERAAATVEKYRRDVRAFAVWLGGAGDDTCMDGTAGADVTAGEAAAQDCETAARDRAAVTKDRAIAYKEYLRGRLAPASVNAVLAALNGFFAFMDWGIGVKPLKIQRHLFRPIEKELTRDEYERLLEAARRAGKTRLDLILQTICAMGLRVGELRFITVAAARAGQAIITNKGKTRTVFLPKALAPMLLSYAKERVIVSGSVFVTKGGKPVDRKNVWADMKKLCAAAGVSSKKVFPHNLRHLFARLFYEKDKDIVRLADLLGHSDIKTTRIYTIESGAEHRRLVDALGLVSAQGSCGAYGDLAAATG